MDSEDILPVLSSASVCVLQLEVQGTTVVLRYLTGTVLKKSCYLTQEDAAASLQVSYCYRWLHVVIL